MYALLPGYPKESCQPIKSQDIQNWPIKKLAGKFQPIKFEFSVGEIFVYFQKSSNVFSSSAEVETPWSVIQKRHISEKSRRKDKEIRRQEKLKHYLHGICIHRFESRNILRTQGIVCLSPRKALERGTSRVRYS